MRFAELAQRFLALELRLPEGPEKEALSLLHAMLQEVWRQVGAGPWEGGGLEELRNLYKKAPKMEAPGWPRGLP